MFLLFCLLLSCCIVAAARNAFSKLVSSVCSASPSIFGCYFTDSNGLHAFNYTNTESLPWPNSMSGPPFNQQDTRHWHMLGNARFNALVSDMGYTQLYAPDRGGAWLNRFDIGWANTAATDKTPEHIQELLTAWIQAQLNVPNVSSHQFQEGWLDSGAANIVLQRWMQASSKGTAVLEAAPTQAIHLGGGLSFLRVYASNSPVPTPNDTVFSSSFMLAPPLSSPNHTGPLTTTTLAFDRTFGIGYATHTSTVEVRPSYVNVSVEHVWWPPMGDVPILIDDVTLSVQGTSVDAGMNIEHWEYFDVNFHQLQTQLTRTWLAGTLGDAWRDAINAQFSQAIEWTVLTAGNYTFPALVSSMQLSKSLFNSQNCSCDYGSSTACPPLLTPDTICGVDYFPPQIVLALLHTSDNSVPVDAAVNQQTFFSSPGSTQGSGTSAPAHIDGFTTIECAAEARIAGLNSSAACPAALFRSPQHTYVPWNTSNAYPQDGILAFKTVHRFNASSMAINVRYAFGYVSSGTTLQAFADQLAAIQSSSPSNPASSSGNPWSSSIMHVSGPDGSPVSCAAETQWRSHNLLASATYRQYLNASIIPQGSAYLYLHGLDGAPRDYVISSIAAAWMDPLLAKSTLQGAMAMQDAVSGQLYYAYGGGYGSVSDALIHAFPSDLDIFLLWGVSTYIRTTGDADILTEDVPYYPSAADSRNKTGSGLEHVITSFNHLTEAVGTGEHGCLRILQGDWDDGVLAEAGPDPIAMFLSEAYGESIPNCGMAAVVLPRVADVLEDVNATVAAAMRSFASQLRTAVMGAYGGSWFGRAWFKDSSNITYLHANDASAAFPVPGDVSNQVYINLQSQVWPLLDAAYPLCNSSDCPPLSSPLLSPLQATDLLATITAQLWNDSSIGPRLTPATGQVWPAISQLLTLAMWRGEERGGEESQRQHTYNNHATVFPSSWAGLMSSPDGLVSSVPGNGTGGWEYGLYSDVEGFTWAAPITTPMTDFPVANSNPEAMYLLSSLAGIGVDAGWTTAAIVADCPIVSSLSCPPLFHPLSPTHLSPQHDAYTSGNGTLPSVSGLINIDVNQSLRSSPLGLHLSTPLLQLHVDTIGNITGNYTSFSSQPSQVLLVKQVLASAAAEDGPSCIASSLRLQPGCTLQFSL